MQGEKVLEIMVGEKEIRNAGRFTFVTVCTSLVISMVEIEIGPNLDGGFLISSSSSSILIF